MSQLPFDEKKLLPNPFGRDIGLPLADDEVDVAEINREAFESCQRLIEEVRAQRASAALTLFGDTGSGKTHLVGRVRRWLNRGSDVLFVLVSMDTSSRMLERHVRRCFAEALLRSNAPGRRAMDDLLGARQSELADLPERDLGIVLENLLNGNNLRDSAAWLRGQELPEAALQRLELAQPPHDEDQETAARNAVVSLCSLIEPGVVVFCLDQMEALQSSDGDTEGLDAVGQAFWVLRDKVRNACIISCVQTGFLPVLEKLHPWVRDRMGRRQPIRQLDWKQARKLVAARLSTLPSLASLPHDHKDPLWPLSEQPIRQVFKDGAAPARKVISRCKDLFDLWRTGKEGPVEEFNAFLQRMLEERTKPVEPADTEAALRNGLPLMLNARSATPAVPGKGAFDFSWDHGKLLIAVCNQANATSLAARLRKIGESWNPSGGQRLLLLRDARLAIAPTAKATRQRLQSLEEKGGRLVAVSQEAVESLAALRRLLADTQSGDLAYRGDPVVPTRVVEWISGHLPTSLDPLVSEIEVPDLLSPKLADLLAQRKIVSLAQAAQELQSRPEEVESCARRDPRLFGILGGSTPVLFQLVEVESVPTDSAE